MADAEADEARQLRAVAALAEPTRRRLYEHVVRQPGPVSRDEVVEALGLPRSNVAFHLDRLVAEGLLDVVFARRSGRSGPGAGRPAELSVSTTRTAPACRGWSRSWRPAGSPRRWPRRASS